MFLLEASNTTKSWRSPAFSSTDLAIIKANPTGNDVYVVVFSVGVSVENVLIGGKSHTIEIVSGYGSPGVVRKPLRGGNRQTCVEYGALDLGVECRRQSKLFRENISR